MGGVPILYFRDITSMSPLQFQRQLRLQEARRLMLIEDLDAGTAAIGTLKNRHQAHPGRRARLRRAARSSLHAARVFPVAGPRSQRDRVRP